MNDLTSEEKCHIDKLNENIKERKLKIALNEWKTAFNRLALWVRNNFSETNSFEVLQKINELRPSKDK